MYGSVGGIEKIYRQQKFPGKIQNPPIIELAKNESEGAQIALYSSIARNNISIELSPMKHNKSNDIFPQSNISATPVGYIKVPPAAYPTRPNILHPDPLLTYLKEFKLDKDCFQPIWIDVKSSETQKSGEYLGHVIIKENNKEILRIPLTIKIWNFALPKKISFPRVFTSDFRLGRVKTRFSDLYEPDSKIVDEARKATAIPREKRENLSPKAKRLLDIGENASSILKAHGITPDDFYRSTKDPIAKWQRMENEETNGNFCLGYTNNYSRQEEFKILEAQVKEMIKEKSINRSYVYGYDEISSIDSFNALRERFGSIKESFPQIKTMTAAKDPTLGERTKTDDVVDIWVPLTSTYIGLNKDVVKKAREKGKQVWWYTCNYPFPPYANLLVENSASATRLLTGYMSYNFGAQGFLYYAVSAWTLCRFSEDTIISLEGNDNVKTLKRATLPSERIFELNPQKDSTAILTAKGNPAQKHHTDMILNFNAKSATKGEINVSLVVNCLNGKPAKHFEFPLVLKNDWQNFSFPIKLDAQAGSFILKIYNKNLNSSEVCNISLTTPGDVRRLLYNILSPMRGGPVVEMEHFPNMVASSGDGSLLLPAENGVVPSIRLKFIRDGFEDYEYLFLLNKYMKYAEKQNDIFWKNWLKEANNVLSMSKKLCPKLDNYTYNGEEILTNRSKIAELLEQAIEKNEKI